MGGNSRVGYASIGAVVATAAILGACFSGPGSMGNDDGLKPGEGPSASASQGIQRSLRRLSRREYDNVVRDLLGDTTAPASGFGIEIYVNGFDNGSDGLTVQGTDLVELQSAAETLAARAVSTNMTALIGACDSKAAAATCVDAFLSTFVKRAYRRPPTDGEKQRLRALYDAGSSSGGFAGGIQLMLEAVLQSPSFLYREELGSADPSLPAGTVRLTDYEVASELSFLMTGSMPDDALMAAVESGKLKTADDLRREAARLMATPAAKPTFRAFLHQWMATDQTASVDKDATVYPKFNAGVATSMATELDRYFDDVLWTGKGTIRELFTSPRGFVDSNLATLYGVKAPATAFDPVALDPAIRSGILTRAGFLAVHADTDSSGPVPRGVFVLNSLLCRPPSPPPPNVPAPPAANDAASAHQTTRQRFDAHLNQPFCSGCHKTIDGVGFGFEQFDGVGAYRTTENGSPVDTSGALVGTDVDGPYSGVTELASKLMSSQELLDCYVRQAYRYAMGQEELSAISPTLKVMGGGFTADATLTSVFTSLVADPAFVLRTTSQTEPGQ